MKLHAEPRAEVRPIHATGGAMTAVMRAASFDGTRRVLRVGMFNPPGLAGATLRIPVKFVKQGR